MSDKSRVVVVTGLSGAGKSTALHALEDLGYFCVDNLPTSLVPSTIEVCESGGIRRIGLGIDVRALAFLDGACPTLTRIAEGRDMAILFLDATDEALLRRFNETRRPHPLSAAASRAPGSAGGLAVLDGVHLERERLAPLRALATIDLDTTRLSVHELRRQIIAHLGPGKAEAPRMSTRFVSFGFKFGVPVDADLIFDVRFLDNPHFVPELRRLPGSHPAVRDFVLQSPEASELLEKIESLLVFSLPRYEREGKSYLTIGIGCTGGRHRSVALAEVLADNLRRKVELPISVVHRDVGRAEHIAQPEPDPSAQDRGVTEGAEGAPRPPDGGGGKT
ncbi:RNase adapter RapZ [Polyangium jinanense]|uniref:RNase adapter RapZ n=1 Tax=Polyangium jinanense TaxID=2829994 RepID=A0A9X3X7R7_9BACT|nr:RNase adapter RapZ [Polyangium jinanense]MDC3960407.1 RNase adapter RapZ [Polyangium jinanense]MDC3985349.1 RNase adapter RapZ [Polyangium jinanense]